MSTAGGTAEDSTWGRGTRRKKFAGYLKAANELRQSYQQSYVNASRSRDDPVTGNYEGGISEAFPELKVARNRHEEMVLFPSYARRHTKQSRPLQAYPGSASDEAGAGEAEYWKNEWEEYENANAVVDVDVRGWIYAPHRGPMNRKNRLLIGMARQLSGIPAPPSATHGNLEPSEGHEHRIAERQAQEIEMHGEQKADIAGRGGFSEKMNSEFEHAQATRSGSSSRKHSPTPGQFPHPVTNSSLEEPSGSSLKRQSWNQPSEMSPKELSVANGHLLKRLKPFLTNPSINVPLTVFFYNDETSQSRTTKTNESGHFNFRAALDFVPTDVRVLASEDLSASEEVRITEPHGISLISDIDDTIKHSAIGSGAREIFRNAFIRDLEDLTVKGVREWYNKMYEMDVKLHYVSNSPWQMYPLLASYFAKAGLPPGSIHLKQYSGMLQGIFEPVAERKKGTLDRIMTDFPERRFILVGDNGEADLELYAETAHAYPGRILGIFIRDVITPPKQGFFDPSVSMRDRGRRHGQEAPGNTGGKSHDALNPDQRQRPALPPRPRTDLPRDQAQEPEENLIEFSDDEKPSQATAASENNDDSTPASKPGPPRPSKPLALRSASSDIVKPGTATSSGPSLQTNPKPPVPTSTKPGPSAESRSPSPLPSKPTAYQNTNLQAPSSRDSSNERQGYRAAVKNKVASAYNALPSASAYWNSGQEGNTALSGRGPQSSDSTTPSSKTAPPVPPRRMLTSYPAAAAQYASNRIWSDHAATNEGGNNEAAAPLINKREELWKRRLARAREALDGSGIVLKIWHEGQDVSKDATDLVERARTEGRDS